MNWNLKEFFNNENEFNEFIDKIKNEAIIFNKTYKDNLEKLDNSEFINALQTLEKINENISKALTYRYLAFAKDTTKGKELTSSELICNEISQNLLFFEIEFNNLEKTKKDKFINTSPKYRYHLELLSKEKVHQLSLLEEKVLLKTSPVGSSAFARLFDETMANLDFDFEDKKIKIETLLSYLSDEDRNKRKNAALSLSKTLDANSHLLTYIYNMIKTDLNIQKELRNYKFSESSMHLYNQIEKESVDNLIKVVEKRFDLSIDYYAKKREILGFEELYDYDRYAPINSDEEITFEESKKIVLKTFGY